MFSWNIELDCFVLWQAVPVSASSFTTASRTADVGFSDFESLVMMKLRQAEERKKLAEQMAEEDREEEKMWAAGVNLGVRVRRLTLAIYVELVVIVALGNIFDPVLSTQFAPNVLHCGA